MLIFYRQFDRVILRNSAALFRLWGGGVAFGLVALGVLHADVSLPAILSDHAILQRSRTAHIWGKAAAGEKVHVDLGGTRAEATAGARGKWLVTLDLNSKAQGPFDLVVEATNKIVVKDVLIGEVWLCAGQSNMEFGLAGSLGASEEIARSANPRLRQFCVNHVGSATPMDDVGGIWTVCEPATVGRWSAVGYYFGKAVQKEMNVPVGLVNASWDSANVETFISQEALDTNETLRKEKDKWVHLDDRFEEFTVRYRKWEKAYQRQDHPVENPDSYAAPNVPIDTWKPLKTSAPFAASGLPDAGAVWLRHKIKIDASQSNKDLRLSFSELRFGSVYWDGVKIDEIAPNVLRTAVGWEPPWTTVVPAKLVKEGESTLAIRVFSPAGDARVQIDTKKCPLLDGEWLARAEYGLPALDAAGRAAYPGMPPVKSLIERLMPSYLFSGMINPLLPYSIKGVIWYQGEANWFEPAAYSRKFRLLINDWRARWGSSLPFYFCQMPAMGKPKSIELGESKFAELREAQSAALTLPNTGQAVLFDTADADLHPRNKKDPAERLARIALARTYGRKMVFSGPVFESMRVDGNLLRVKFRNADGGLVARPLPAEYALRYESVSPDVPVTAPLLLPSPKSKLQGFAIRGGDGKWRWADARIEHTAGAPLATGTVVVWSDAVSSPVAVRYAWADNPTANLYNGAGLPSAPFRSDPPVSNVDPAGH